MSTDAWIEEHWIGEAVLPRPRRAPKLPALQVPHAPTCSRGNAALAAHAQSRDSARHPGDGLSSRQNGRNVVDQQARKLTQPPGQLDRVAPSHIDLHHMAMPQTPRTSTPTEVLAGLVERVTFHNAENGFCVLRVKARGQRDLITILGHAAMISAGECVQASGTWINDRTHGV